MKHLYHSDFMLNLKHELTQAKKSIVIVSPYITAPAVEQLLGALPAKNIEKTIITLPFGPEYLQGSIEIKALRKLEAAGFTLLSLARLHSKIYWIDQKTAFLGSANFTGKGWGLLKDGGNVEVMTKIALSAEDVTELKTIYLEHCRPLVLSTLERLMTEGEALYNAYQQLEQQATTLVKSATTGSTKPTRHELFLQKLQEQNHIVSFSKAGGAKQYGKNVFHLMLNDGAFSAKLMYSGLGAPTKTYSTVYDFELTRTSAEQAKANRLDFIMLLGNAEGSTHRYVHLPAAFMKNKVLKTRFFNKKSNSWQFSICEAQEALLLRCFSETGEEHRLPIGEFEKAFAGSATLLS